MNSEPLPLSSPTSGTGKRCHTWWMAAPRGAVPCRTPRRGRSSWWHCRRRTAYTGRSPGCCCRNGPPGRLRRSLAGHRPVRQGPNRDLLAQFGARARGRCAAPGTPRAAGARSRASVGRLACRSSSSTAVGSVSSPSRVSRSSSSGTKGWSRSAPIRPLACHRTSAAVATSGPYERGRPPGRGSGAAGRAAEQPDGRLAVNAGDRNDLVQEPAFLRARCLQVARSLDQGVLPKAGSCHGLLPTGVGNRDF